MKQKLIDALKRAAWTAAETALVMIPTTIVIWDIDWLPIVGLCLTTGLVSFIKSLIATPPETVLEAELEELDLATDEDVTDAENLE